MNKAPFMKPEPKSIFTPHQDLDTQSTKERTSSPCKSSSAISPSSIPPPSARALEAEAGLPRRQPHDSPQNSAYPTRNLPSGAESQAESRFRKPEAPCIQPSTPNPTNASKRPRSEDSGLRLVSTSEERPSKRNRLKLRPRHTLDPESFKAAKKLTGPKLRSPPSPLFFSHTPRQRPVLPAGFSSSELAATMLNKARDEVGGITTLKLARGSVSNVASPPRSTSTPGSWASFERSSLPRSPDARGKSPGMQILGSVGIVELLEQDERPTFIIDVANPVNFKPGGMLQLIFANASLRAQDAILEMITGKDVIDSSGIVNDFPAFKAWALSFVKNNESMGTSYFNTKDFFYGIPRDSGIFGVL